MSGSPVLELVDRAAEAGRVPLVDLSDDAVTLLSGGEWMWHDLAAWSTWQELPALEREARARRALASAEAAGALRWWRVTGDGVEFELTVEGYVVHMARTAPSFVACGTGEDGVADGPGFTAPRCYGISDETGVVGVVMELVGPATRSFRLLSPQQAATSWSRWLDLAVRSEEVGHRQQCAGVIAYRGGPSEDVVLATAVQVDVCNDEVVARQLGDDARDREPRVGVDAITALVGEVLTEAGAVR
ncbi:MAG: hypothetical protein Q4G43_11295 [Mobilicoccus sp.]|nr:hypothetical protein [Mobilicoccus sp.]